LTSFERFSHEDNKKTQTTKQNTNQPTERGGVEAMRSPEGLTRNADGKTFAFLTAPDAFIAFGIHQPVSLCSLFFTFSSLRLFHFSADDIS
jgi:hypothetical protein